MKFRHKCCACIVPTEHKLVNALYERTSNTPESDMSKKLNDLIVFSLKSSDNVETVSKILAGQIKKDINRNKINRVRYGLRYYQALWTSCDKHQSNLMPCLIEGTSSLSIDLLNSSEPEFICYGLDFFMKMAGNKNIRFNDTNYLWHHTFFVERITKFCTMPKVEYRTMAILSIQALIKNSILSNKTDLIWLSNLNIKILDSLLWNLNTRNDQVDQVDRKYALECYNDLIDSAHDVQQLEPAIMHVCAYTDRHQLWHDELVVYTYFNKFVSKDPAFFMRKIEEHLKHKKGQGMHGTHGLPGTQGVHGTHGTHETNDIVDQVKSWLLSNHKFKIPLFS